MKHVICLLMILCFFLNACNEKDIAVQNAEVRFTGNLSEKFVPPVETRTTFYDTLLSSSRTALFSQGAIQATGIGLTLHDGQWKSDEPLYWESASALAEIKAYYPYSLPIEQQFYEENGELKDLLCAEQTVPQGTDIQLSFGHVFAKLTLRIAHSFNRRIEKIEFTPSLIITGLEPHEKRFTTASHKKPVTLETRPDGIYSQLIPSNLPLAVSLTVHTDDNKTYTYDLPEQTYLSGHEYIYPINSQQKGIGIKNTEDYIAFTHLINGFEYPGRTLDEFGETIDGRTTYYLLSDLTFTPEESSRIREIGYLDGTKKVLFTDTFEGNYHSLSGITVTDPTTYNYYGIFGYVGKEGIVRNLIVKDFTITVIDKKPANIAGLAALNYGLIQNCMVQNFTAESTTNEDVGAGGLCKNNYGIILNCRLEDLTIIGTFSGVAGITYRNVGGKIINCQVYNIHHNEQKEIYALFYNTRSATTQGVAYNTLSYNVGGVLPYSESSYTYCWYCYYPSNISLKFDNNPTLQFIPYNESTFICTDKTPVETALNTPKLASDYDLIPWQTDSDGCVKLNTYGY